MLDVDSLVEGVQPAPLKFSEPRLAYQLKLR